MLESCMSGSVRVEPREGLLYSTERGLQSKLTIFCNPLFGIKYASTMKNTIGCHIVSRIISYNEVA